MTMLSLLLHKPKSRLSRMRTISVPGMSSASGTSVTGRHWPVPGIRPFWQHWVNSFLDFENQGLTSTVIRVFEDRRTTSRSDIIKLTMIPISTFQTTERAKVINIIAKSGHAPILLSNPQVRWNCVDEELHTCSSTLGHVEPRQRGT